MNSRATEILCTPITRTLICKQDGSQWTLLIDPETKRCQIYPFDAPDRDRERSPFRAARPCVDLPIVAESAA